jgi:hypothetical protein
MSYAKFMTFSIPDRAQRGGFTQDELKRLSTCPELQIVVKASGFRLSADSGRKLVSAESGNSILTKFETNDPL